MRSYEDVLLMLGVPPAALELARGAVAIADPAVIVPFKGRGFPPALLPFWSVKHLQFVGFWKHWFCDRNLSLVSYDLTMNNEAYEIGRDFDQLVHYQCLRLLYAGTAIETLKPLAAASGVDLARVARAKAGAADESGAMRALFPTNPPLYVCPPPDAAGYAGDFPYPRMNFAANNLRRFCTLEAEFPFAAPAARGVGSKASPLSWKQQAAQSGSAPIWFGPPSQPEAFDGLLKHGDHLGAWMSLNSHGWEFAAAKDALRRLAAKASDAAFSTVSEAWCAIDHERAGEY